MGVGRGNGKLLLFGEHSAVYGYPALGLQLPHHLEVTLIPGTAEWLIPDLDERSRDLISRALDRLADVTGLPVDPCEVQLNGDLPTSAGLGSSAAFCVALIRAAAGAFGDGASLTGANAGVLSLWKMAHELEKVFHGTPSGIDTGLSVLPGASLMRRTPGSRVAAGIPTAQPVLLPTGWLVAGAVPRERSTAELVAGIRERMAADPDNVEATMERLGCLAEQAATITGAVPPVAVEHLGQLADEAHLLLAGFGLSTPVVEQALELLRTNGAAGAKLSGAGGGGAFYGVFADRGQAESAAVRLGTLLQAYPLPSGPFCTLLSLR